MAKRIINTGRTPNDKTGDSLKLAFTKVNENFTELYTALGLNEAPLNLGAFEFTGSVLSTTDSTSITIDQATTITSNLTVGGDILPSVALGGDLGSAARPWRSLYVSNNTIFLGGTALSVNGAGNLLVNGSLITGGTTSYNNLSDKPNLGTYATQNDINTVLNEIDTRVTTISYNDLLDKPNIAGTYQFSVAADDSTQRVINTDEVVKFTGAGGITTASDAEGNITINYVQGDIKSNGNINIDINLADSTLRRWQFGEDGELTFPDGYLKVVPNGANPYISNRTDNGLGLVSGSAIQIRQSTADAYGITIDSSTTNTAGTSTLGVGSSIDVNGTKIVLGKYTYVSDVGSNQTAQNKIEINNDAILIGPYSSNTVDGSTVTAFTGWTFGAGGLLSLGASSGGIHANQDTGIITIGDNISPNGAPYAPSTVIQVGGATNAFLISAYGPPARSWTFGMDGALTVPGDIKSSGNINIDINLTDSTLRRWSFGEDGALTLPSVGKINNGAYDWTFGSTGNTTFPTGLTLGAPRGVGTVNFTAAVNKEFQIETGTATSGKLWQFGTDGSLTIPGDIKSNSNINIDINLTDSTLRRWQFGEDGALTFPTGASIVNGYPGPDGEVGGGQSWFVTPSDRSGGVASSDGKQYVQVDNVGLYIGTNYTANTGNTWTFGTDGSLRLPNGAEIKDNAGNSVSFGTDAGGDLQGNYSVAIGYSAAYTQQGNSAVAIGYSAGGGAQGNYAIAIGYLAGSQNQAANSIVLNATGITLDQTTANSFKVAPIRNISATSGVLQYNSSTKEVSYSNSVTAERFNTDQITVVGNRISTTVTNANLELECNGTGAITINNNTTIASSSLTFSGNISAAAWTTSGIRHVSVPATLTDTTSSGTVANAYTNNFGGNTIAASNATTYTNYATVFLNDPTAGTNVTITNSFSLITAGNVKLGSTGTGTIAAVAATATTASTAASVGYMGMPQQSKSSAYTTVIGDAGKHIYVTATATITIDSNANVAYPIGTTIAFIAAAGATVTIAITSDTMYLGGTGTTGSRTLAAYGMATAVKVASTSWFINGAGLT